MPGLRRIETHAPKVADEFVRFHDWCCSPAPLRIFTDDDAAEITNRRHIPPSVRDYEIGDGVIRVTFERILD